MGHASVSQRPPWKNPPCGDSPLQSCRNRELTKRGPAAVRLIVRELGRGEGAGFLALAVDSDFSLILGSAVLVELTLGHPRETEAREKGHSAGVQGQNSAPLLPAFLGLPALGEDVTVGSLPGTTECGRVRFPGLSRRPAPEHTEQHSMSRAPKRTAQSSCAAGR